MTITEKLVNLSARLLLSNDKTEVIGISSELNDLAKETLPTITSQIEKTGVLKFTQKEISKMPKKSKNIFLENGALAHLRKRRSGPYNYCYELRYRRNGLNVYAASTSLEKAKEKFIIALAQALQGEKPANKKQFAFENIAEEWFSCRKGKITETTYNAYYRYYKHYIFPTLAGKNIRDIRSAKLVELMKQTDGKTRVYEDVRTVLNQIFNYAQLNGIIQNNPVRLVEFIRFERKSKDSLTKEEITYFLKRVYESQFDKYRTALLLQLYFGLRPCETASAKIDGNFLVAQNAKRKKGKIEYKRIPFSRMAKEHISEIPTYIPGTSHLNKVFQRIFPDKTQYYLRHTFSSKCQEYVRQEIVNVWLGDSSDKLIGKTYTHYSDEFMLSEMNKVYF